MNPAAHTVTLCVLLALVEEALLPHNEVRELLVAEAAARVAPSGVDFVAGVGVAGASCHGGAHQVQTRRVVPGGA